MSKAWLRIGIAAVFAGQGMVLSLALNMTPPPYGSTPYWVLHGGLVVTSLAVMVFLGGPLFVSAWGMFRSRQLSIEGLFLLSLLGAFVGSLVGSVTGEGNVYYEIVSVVIAIYTFGRMLGERSKAKMLMESDRIREKLEQAERVVAGGQTEMVPVGLLKIGDRVRVGPGGVFTADGRIVDGVGFVEETPLTGEPLPVVRRTGEFARAGTYSVDGHFEIEVTAGQGSREVDRILAAVEQPGGVPSELQAQANRLTQYFLPVVVAVSLGTAGFWWYWAGWQAAVFNSMAVLLVACPCALGLATPVAIWNGLYRLSQLGLVSRDGGFIDALARTRHLFFDKTGTLSEQAMEVVECYLPEAWQAHRHELFNCVMAVESRVSHPVASGLLHYCRQAGARGEGIELKELRHCPGQGVSAIVRVDGRPVELQIGDFESDAAGRVAARAALFHGGKKEAAVYCDGRLAGLFVLREKIRENVPQVWEGMRARGITCSVLTGDPSPKLKLPEDVEIQAGLTAEEKAARIREALELDECPVFVGDGLNDAPAMAAASGSVAMVSGVSLSRSAASAQLLNNRLERLLEAIDLSSSIHLRLRGNLIYAASYNILGMSLAAVGWLHPVAAAGIMLLSSFFVTMRALRA
ncbi:MAG: heavy metal translocating P-type ATPase [Opitutales bacterium]